VLILKSSPEFQRVARLGKRWSAPAFIIQVLIKEPATPFRLGLTASRKVGNAVVRNRAKRRLREMIRTFGTLPTGVDLVLIAKTAAAEHDFLLMKGDFMRGLQSLGIIS
jgi:ribonuclease P protein component